MRKTYTLQASFYDNTVKRIDKTKVQTIMLDKLILGYDEQDHFLWLIDDTTDTGILLGFKTIKQAVNLITKKEITPEEIEKYIDKKLEIYSGTSKLYQLYLNAKQRYFSR